MWTLVLLVLMIALAVAVFFVRRRLRTAFRIEVRDGEARVVHGEVDDQFVEDVENICKLWGIESGTVRGMREARGVEIRCKGKALGAQRRAIQNALDNPL